jgi:hypothetical protein
MGRKYTEECCCVKESLYGYEVNPEPINAAFDLKASYVSIDRPKYGQGEAIYYAAASPPTGYHLESVARVKIWDQVEATLTAKLVPRPMPAAWFPVAHWNYDASIHNVGQNTGAHPLYELNVNSCSVPTTIIPAYYYGDNDDVVEGFSDFAEPAQGSFPANPGTSLSQLTAAAREGLGDIVLYCLSMGINTASRFNQVDGGWVTSPFPNNWPNYNYSFPMQTFGYDSSFFLAMDGQSRWVLGTSNDSPGNQYNYYAGDEPLEHGRRRRAWFKLEVGTYLPGNPPGDISEQAVITAHTFCPRLPSFPLYTGRTRETSAYPVKYFEVTHEADRNAYASFYFFTNKTIKQFNGNEVTVYRNGVQVLSATYPTIEQSRAATQEEGTYLIVNEVTGATDDPSTPLWYSRDMRFHKAFDCIVIDKTPPVVSFEAIDDFFGTTTAPYGIGSAIIPTEPIGSYGGTYEMLDDAGILIGQSYGGSGFSGGGAGPRQRTITLNAGGLWDYAGNLPERVMSHPLTIHDYPVSYYFPGAKPKLSRFEKRTRTQAEKVQTVTLEFDRKINPAGVTASQFTLDKDNQRVSGLTAEPIGDGSLAWKITIPLDIQTPRSFFVVTYNPGGNVYTDDILTVRGSSRASFPTTGKYKTKYVYADDDGVDRWFSWSLSGYVSIAQGEAPLFPYGGHYDPEPTVLAARTSWIMADMNGHPRCIDPQSWMWNPFIGRVASITTTKTIDTTKTASEAQTIEPGNPSGFMLPNGETKYGRYDEVNFKQYENRRGFIPAVPSPTSPREGCSYFGLTTTIDPSPPAAVHECAAPSENQKHSSAIISDGEITSFIVSMEMRDTSGNLITDFSNDSYLGYGVDGFDIGTPFDAAEKIMAFGGFEYTFISTLQGRPLAQNVWSCIDGVRGNGYPSRVMRTGSPTLCDENNQKYYRFTMTEPGGTTFSRGQRGGKTRTAQAVFTQDSMQATLSLFRDTKTYPNLYTTVLGNLSISLSFRMAVKRTTTYTEYGISGSPIGYIKTYYYGNPGVCPSTLVAASDDRATGEAVYAESQMQQIGQPKEVVGRFFDYVGGTFQLSKLEEIALGQGQTITKELFQQGPTRIWTVKIRKG